MKSKLTNLIETRKIMALLVILLFIALSLLNRLDKDFIQTVIISVIAYYFGKATALDQQKKGEDK